MMKIARLSLPFKIEPRLWLSHTLKENQTEQPKYQTWTKNSALSNFELYYSKSARKTSFHDDFHMQTQDSAFMLHDAEIP